MTRPSACVIQKRALRRRVMASRDRLSAKEVAAGSLCILANLQTLSTFQEARTVHLFASFGTEVDTRPILEVLWARGARVVLPRVASARLLEHRVVADPGDLQPGFRDIPEPGPHCPECLVDEIDLVLVPGVAFDHAGRRLGYGGGYYDHFLLTCPAPRVALAFHLQLVDEVPCEPHDLRVDRVVTDVGVVRATDPLTRS